MPDNVIVKNAATEAALPLPTRAPSHVGERGRSARQLPDWLTADLRSDHAGETGAVAIYRGILAVSHDPWIRGMATSHLATEIRHLAMMNRLVPKEARSRLLPLWRVAGWLTGALPALIGPRAVFVTIAAVETFVDDHYRAQIRALDAMPQHSAIYNQLVSCWQDEVHHRDEAAALAGPRPSMIARAWSALVGAGSRLAVAAARRF